MEFETRLSVIFLEFIQQTINFDFFIDQMLKLIEDQREEGYWKDVINFIISDQNSFFLKIVQIYSITIFETFSCEFFMELSKEKKLSKKTFKTTPSKMLEFFEKNFKINLENDFKLWEGLRENICRRNVITHNMGRIDQQYINCINDTNSDLKDKMVGIDIPHNLKYIKKSNDIVGKYIVFTFKKITELYNLTDIKETVRTILNNGHFPDVNPDLLDDVEI